MSSCKWWHNIIGKLIDCKVTNKVTKGTSDLTTGVFSLLQNTKAGILHSNDVFKPCKLKEENREKEKGQAYWRVMDRYSYFNAN